MLMTRVFEDFDGDRLEVTSEALYQEYVIDNGETLRELLTTKFSGCNTFDIAHYAVTGELGKYGDTYTRTRRIQFLEDQLDSLECAKLLYFLLHLPVPEWLQYECVKTGAQRGIKVYMDAYNCTKKMATVIYCAVTYGVPYSHAAGVRV